MDTWHIIADQAKPEASLSQISPRSLRTHLSRLRDSAISVAEENPGVGPTWGFPQIRGPYITLPNTIRLALGTLAFIQILIQALDVLSHLLQKTAVYPSGRCCWRHILGGRSCECLIMQRVDVLAVFGRWYRVKIRSCLSKQDALAAGEVKARD